MNDQEKENIENAPVTETEIVEIEQAQTAKPFYKQKPFLMAATIIGIILLGVFGLLIYRAASSEEGRPVPAPRNAGFGSDQTSGDSNNLTEQTLTITPEQLEQIKLETATVGETMSDEVSGETSTGVVRANDYAETPVISLVGGVVRNVSAQLGEFVQRGETVAVVYSDELAAAQSNYLSMLAEQDEYEKRYRRALELAEVSQESRTELDRAEADLEIAQAKLTEEKSDFERTQKLVRIGAASRQQMEEATTELRTAEANAEAARERLERARRLLKINPERRNEIDRSLAQLRSMQAKAEAERQKLLVLGLSPQRINQVRTTRRITSELPVAAPVSGTVTERMVNNGEIISANKELYKVTNLGTVWVIAEVFEKDLAGVRVGSGASVTTDAYPGRVFRGQVTYIDPTLNETTRTAQARVELANPDGILKIGQYVNVAFGSLGMAEKTAPVVPLSAVQTIGSKSIVFLTTDQPTVFILRQVRLGKETDGKFIVLEGLNVGDTVVTSGSFLLRAEWLKTNSGNL